MDVFLGSSRKLYDMRTAFGALVDSLADASMDSCGVDVVARMWETESYAVERDRSKQAAYDEVIRTSDLAFFLVDGYLGDYTLHEYLVASESYVSCGKPEVTAWVRTSCSPSGMEASGTAPALEEPIDSNTRRLLDSASCIQGVEIRELAGEDELLLDMIELMALHLGPVPLNLQESGVWTGHKRLVSLEGVPAERVDVFAEWLEQR